MRSTAVLAGACAALLLAGCATRAPAPPAPPAAVPAAAPSQPLPPPLPAPPPATWEDMALTAGDWRYTAAPAPEAAFGDVETAFILRCDPQARQVLLVRHGAAAGAALTLRTTSEERTLPIGNVGAATVAAGDPLLDAILFSRGRFAVEAPGLPALILPTWPEPARVVEDCRPG